MEIFENVGRFVWEKDCEVEVLDSGVRRCIKGYIDDLMVAELKWDKGQVGAVHSHPHRQCDYIISGTFEAELNGEKRILKAGARPMEIHRSTMVSLSVCHTRLSEPRAPSQIALYTSRGFIRTRAKITPAQTIRERIRATIRTRSLFCHAR